MMRADNPPDAHVDLDNATRRGLKARAHHLKPVVLIGQHGVTDAVTAEVDRALTDHELIKLRFRGHDREARRSAVTALCEALEAALVSVVGGTVVLYREDPDAAPANAPAGSRA